MKNLLINSLIIITAFTVSPFAVANTARTIQCPQFNSLTDANFENIVSEWRWRMTGPKLRDYFLASHTKRENASFHPIYSEVKYGKMICYGEVSYDETTPGLLWGNYPTQHQKFSTFVTHDDSACVSKQPGVFDCPN